MAKSNHLIGEERHCVRIEVVFKLIHDHLDGAKEHTNRML